MRYITAFLFGAVIGAMIKDSLFIAISSGIICVIVCKLFEIKTNKMK